MYLSVVSNLQLSTSTCTGRRTDVERFTILYQGRQSRSNVDLKKAEACVAEETQFPPVALMWSSILFSSFLIRHAVAV